MKACIFDAFGTLFNLNESLLQSIEHPKVPEILSYAREKQLSYTWLKSLMKEYVNFETITQIALSDGCRKFHAPHKLVDELASIYMKPTIFDDVIPALEALKAKNIKCGILSNGTHAMLNSGITLNALSDYLDVVYSADDIKTFKPDPAVYQMVCDGEDCDPNQILFISSNQWDIAGAHAFGFKTCWLNRQQSFRESLISGKNIVEIDAPINIFDFI